MGGEEAREEEEKRVQKKRQDEARQTNCREGRNPKLERGENSHEMRREGGAGSSRRVRTRGRKGKEGEVSWWM
jgi:hypothetical protein